MASKLDFHGSRPNVHTHHRPFNFQIPNHKRATIPQFHLPVRSNFLLTRISQISENEPMSLEFFSIYPESLSYFPGTDHASAPFSCVQKCRKTGGLYPTTSSRGDVAAIGVRQSPVHAAMPTGISRSEFTYAGYSSASTGFSAHYDRAATTTGTRW